MHHSISFSEFLLFFSEYLSLSVEHTTVDIFMVLTAVQDKSATLKYALHQLNVILTTTPEPEHRGELCN